MDGAELEFRVRPYALTGGRTRAGLELPIETLVRTNDRGRAVLNQVGIEDRRILTLALEPLSLAELSAHMGVVVGAVRVLVGDLVAAGFLDARHVRSTGTPDIKLLERVLDGLKSL